MFKSSPYYWLTPPQHKQLFAIFFILTIVVITALQFWGRPLTTSQAPAGIISYEFAGDLKTSQNIIESWGMEGRIYAGINLGLDFLFMAVYPVVIGLGCVIVGRNWLTELGNFLSWAMLAAGLLDAVENFALIRVLLGAEAALWPGLARWAAIPKFGLVLAGLAFVILGTAVHLKNGRFSN